MQAEIDLLTNQIDVSEIISDQGFAPGAPIMNGELLLSIENLAKDIGYSFSTSLQRRGNTEIECALDISEITPTNDEWMQIIFKASSKIRELRELIENLSK